MVKRVNADGGVWHEPPYTKEEIEEFDRRVGGGPVAFTRPEPARAKPQAAPARAPKRPSAKPRRT